jgi:2-methylisocitrate lyase-like PEP mutase family enzyme
VSVTQNEKATRFRALHDGPGAFVIPNPWDVGSARILAGLEFQALATSSAASASALGRRDGGLTRDEAMAHARLIVDATDLPVSADLETGFGDPPEVVAETIRLAADAGLVGCTIEDATRNQEAPLYDLSLAVERIVAAAEAARTLQFPFLLTARAHNLLYAAPSMDETISRLQAFEKAGADVLFAPGLPNLRGTCSLCGRVEACQFHGRNQRKIIFGRRTGGSRSAAYQPCDLALSRRNDRLSPSCMRSERRRPVRFPRSVRDHAGTDQNHAALTAHLFQNGVVGVTSGSILGNRGCEKQR